MLTFGQKLKNARRLSGMTQRKLGELIGAKHNSISNWEADQNSPDADTIELICKVLSLPGSYFFGREQSELSELEFALYGEVSTLSEDDLRDVLDFIRFKRSLPDKESEE